MKRFNNWKSIALATFLPLLIAAQPAITYACNVGGQHTGC